MKKIRNKKKGFTLVELLAVIVILAIILVIAVPKVMSIIEDAKMGTLESTAKMIASAAEKQKVQNTVLGNTQEITCDSVAKINKGDYANCSIEFVDNTAKVTIEGAGKFDNLWVCAGTKTSAEAQNEECSSPLQVKHPLFLAGQELTPDKFEVTLTEGDGSTRKLWDGGLKTDESKAVIVTSPNWPNNYPENSTDEIEKTFDGAGSLEITFDPASSFADDYSGNSTLIAYDNNGNEVYNFYVDSSAGKTYVIPGNYVKIKITTDSFGVKGYSATIKPMYNVEPEYTISPSVAPTNGDKFDITITVKEQNISKKITTNLYHKLDEYVTSLLPYNEELENPKETYEQKTYDTGIRYVGNNPKNNVYYNCDDRDSDDVAYGEANYDYASSCEVWRIVGVFDTKTSVDGNANPRVKLINTASTFESSWDSSGGTYGYDWNADCPDCRGTNCGWGINQWGESKYDNGTIYEGADLMRLLNGYYISKEGTTCTYCNGENQSVCEQTCTSNSLKDSNMKVLTSTAKNMIENAVWDTYAIYVDIDGYTNEITWLEEKGISTQYLGDSFCNSYPGPSFCQDGVERTSSWTGLVGLIYGSDIDFAKGWLKNSMTITPASEYTYSGNSFAHSSGVAGLAGAYDSEKVQPSVYLKNGIKVIGGNGGDKPYILAS